MITHLSELMEQKKAQYCFSPPIFIDFILQTLDLILHLTICKLAKGTLGFKYSIQQASLTIQISWPLSLIFSCLTLS